MNKFVVVALVMMAGCTPKTEYIVKTQFVDRVVETQVPLDPRLTHTTALPAVPPFKCTDSAGRRSVCARDMVDYMEAYRRAAADRDAQIKAIAELQPKP